MNRKALLEAAKELGRVLLFAAIGWGIAYLTSLPESSTTLVALFVLKSLDKFVHENPNIKANGVAPF